MINVKSFLLKIFGSIVFCTILPINLHSTDRKCINLFSRPHISDCLKGAMSGIGNWILYSICKVPNIVSYPICTQTFRIPKGRIQSKRNG